MEDEVKELRAIIIELELRLTQIEVLFVKHDAWLKKAHELCSHLGVPAMHIEDRLIAATQIASELRKRAVFREPS